jgi:hypothetical protein
MIKSANCQEPPSVTDIVPRVASTLVRNDLFLPFLFLIDGILMWPRFMAIPMILFCPIACLFVIRDLSTELSPDGVSQLTWRGRVYVGWDAVEDVKRNANSIVVHAPTGRVVIAYQKFSDSGATVRFVNAHLPRNLRE